MAIKTILFDLDGTLLPMDQDIFVEKYMRLLSFKMIKFGYNPEMLVKSIWQGTKYMILNNGKNTNEKVFWDKMVEIYNESVLDDIDKFDTFYQNEFEQVKEVCGYNPKAKEIIKKLKNDGINLVLATNPIFPLVATKARIRWAGLEKEDFSYITTYENSSFCKPNTKYYEEILNKFNLNPSDCLMVGNDTSDDLAAASLGIKVFLLTDNLINVKNIDITKYPNGNFDDLLEYINKNR